MRRRGLLGGSIEYVFSASTSSLSASCESDSTSINIVSTANESNIAYSATKSGDCISGVYSGDSKVTIYFAANNSGNGQRNGVVTLTQNGSGKTLKITVTQASNNLLILNVLFYNKSNGQKIEYPYSTWSGFTSSGNYYPIGIAISGLTKTYMSLKYMDYNTPDTGSDNKTRFYWGGAYQEDPGLPVYGKPDKYLYVYAQDKCGGLVGDSSSKLPSEITGTDGKSDTDIILAFDNATDTSWQTASTISNRYNTAHIHPPVQCCWRYSTSGTSQGDWYLPSIGELAYFSVISYAAVRTSYRLNQIWSNCASYNYNPWSEGDLWSSSSAGKSGSLNYSWYYYPDNDEPYFKSIGRGDGNRAVKAFLRL